MNKKSVVIVGCGKRTRNTFLPILREMTKFVKLVAVCNRSEEKAREIGTLEGVPYYTSLDELIKKEKPDIAIVAVSRENHAEPTIKLINAGIHVLLETPIADSLEDADAIIEAASKSNSIIEVAENYYRTPREQIVQKIIKSGIFGKLHVVYSNFAGHGYHGLGLIRGYLGFSAKPKRVIGFTSTYNVTNHIWRAGQPPRDTEDWQHGVIEYDNNAVGVYSYSSLTYGSPMRQEQEKNHVSFYAEKGMGAGHDLLILEEPDTRVNIPIEKRTKSKNGVDLLDAYVAKTKPEIEWINPLSNCLLNDTSLRVALCFWDLLEAIRENKNPEYGLINARIDRATELALEESWLNNNKPVILNF